MINLSDFEVRLANHRAFVGQIDRANELDQRSLTVDATPRRSALRGLVHRVFRSAPTPPLAREEERGALAIGGS